MAKELRRCSWVSNEPLYVRYHDDEWGVPVHDDRLLFEMLILEGAQAGLSWITVLRKRENYRRVFDGFDAKKLARWDARRIAGALKDEGIVRNKLKVESTVSNAKALLALQKEEGSLDAFAWSFVKGLPVNRPKGPGDWRATSPESDALSKALKKRGFRFVGSTIVYAWMQACGLVDDHAKDCFRAAKSRM
ncbi:MAG TPA: DNA-3-methyladenine glycosylase I [Polyangiaceae bacterium]|jgi:DNA-3-methyladenine glycosylase I